MRGDAVIHYESGSVKIVEILGDLRNDAVELSGVFWFHAFPVTMVIPGVYTEERKIFTAMDYPVALDLCAQRNISCMWVKTHNALDTAVLESENANPAKHDVLRFEDKKTAMLFKLSME